MVEARLDDAFEMGFEREDGLVGFRRRLAGIQSGLHGAKRNGYLRALDAWPALPYLEWKDTFETLRLWLQIAGKVRLGKSPRGDHHWDVSLSVTPRGPTPPPPPPRGGPCPIALGFLYHHPRDQS